METIDEDTNNDIILSISDATKEKLKDSEMQISSVTTPFKEQCKQRSMKYQLILHIGKPGEGIVDLVKIHNPHLLIVGWGGLNAIRENSGTSVSEYVYHHAKIPLLIVGNDWQECGIEDEKQNGKRESLV